MKQISVWLREDVPADLQGLVRDLWNDEEPVIAVAHVPQHVLESTAYELSLSLAPYPPQSNPDPRMRWFSESGMGLLAATPWTSWTIRKAMATL